MPKGIGMLVKAVIKTIDENKIDEILNGILDFLGNTYVHIERILADTDEQENANADEKAA